MINIDQQRLALLLSDEVHLRSGAGAGANGVIDVCVMQAADWLQGGTGTDDAPSCVDPVIRGFCIRLNDSALFSGFRDDLKPYAARTTGTATDDIAARKRRIFMCADFAIRVGAPMWFDNWAERVPTRADEARGLAAKLRSVPEITDADTANAGRAVAREVQRAAAAAASAASDAAAYAAYAASAPSPSAAGAASAASVAYAAAASVAAASAASAAFRRTMFDLALAHLDRLIAVTALPA